VDSVNQLLAQVPDSRVQYRILERLPVLRSLLHQKAAGPATDARSKRYLPESAAESLFPVPAKRQKRFAGSNVDKIGMMHDRENRVSTSLGVKRPKNGWAGKAHFLRLVRQNQKCE